VAENPEKNKGGKPKIKPELKKVVVAATLDPEIVEWTKEWATRRDRSFSWAINHFIKERRNRELAEKYLGQKVVR
jgi:hypothetical protein